VSLLWRGWPTASGTLSEHPLTRHLILSARVIRMPLRLATRGLLPDLTFVQRQRTPLPVILLALILYQKGLSFRRVAEILAILRQNLSHTSVWRWVQKQGQSLTGKLWCGDMPARIVVDETVIRTSYGKLWVYAALDPKDRRLIYLDVYRSRDALRTWVFFRQMQRIYGALPRVALVDGGYWYIEPLKQLEVKRVVLHCGVRNYVERFFKTLKRRLGDFDRFFPCRDGPGYPAYWNWLVVFSWYYNVERKHTMALK
jgi:transposase-like protein